MTTLDVSVGTVAVDLAVNLPDNTVALSASVGTVNVAMDIGLAGASGPQGPQGFQGATGAQGTQGFQGVVGATGSQGFQGVQGTQGFQGLTGTQGTQGVQGATGAQGVQGAQGFQGLTGTQGTQGVQGATGAQGVQGAQGFQGTAGNRTSTVVVAASNATALDKASADYVCAGTDDQNTINLATSYIGNIGGGKVYLTEGTFSLSAPVYIDHEFVTFCGAGMSTILLPASNFAGTAAVVVGTCGISGTTTNIDGVTYQNGTTVPSAAPQWVILSDFHIGGYTSNGNNAIQMPSGSGVVCRGNSPDISRILVGNVLYDGISIEPFMSLGAGTTLSAAVTTVPSAPVYQGTTTFNVASTAGFTGHAITADPKTTTAVGTGSTTSITLSATNYNIAVGQLVTGTNIVTGTRVKAISGTALTLTVAPSASISGATLSFFGYDYEIVTVVSVGSGTLSVSRGNLNTTARTHSSGTVIYPLTYTVNYNVLVSDIAPDFIGRDGIAVRPGIDDSVFDSIITYGGETPTNHATIPRFNGRYGFYLGGSNCQFKNCHPYFYNSAGIYALANNYNTFTGTDATQNVWTGGEVESNGWGTDSAVDQLNPGSGVYSGPNSWLRVDNVAFYRNGSADVWSNYATALMLTGNNFYTPGAGSNNPTPVFSIWCKATPTFQINDNLFSWSGNEPSAECILIEGDPSGTTAVGSSVNDNIITTTANSINVQHMSNAKFFNNSVKASIVESASSNHNEFYNNTFTGSSAKVTTSGANSWASLNFNTAGTSDGLSVLGTAGASAASRYVGGTTAGAPVTGTYKVGDWCIDQTGMIWVCTVAGTSGTWAATSGGRNALQLSYDYTNGFSWSGAPTSGFFRIGTGTPPSGGGASTFTAATAINFSTTTIDGLSALNFLNNLVTVNVITPIGVYVTLSSTSNPTGKFATYLLTGFYTSGTGYVIYNLTYQNSAGSMFTVGEGVTANFSIAGPTGPIGPQGGTNLITPTEVTGHRVAASSVVGASSYNVPISGTPTVGNLLVMYFRSDYSSAPTSATVTSGGGAWTQADFTSGIACGLFYKVAAAADTGNATITYSSAVTDYEALLTEWANADGLDIYSAEQFANGGGSTWTPSITGALNATSPAAFMAVGAFSGGGASVQLTTTSGTSLFSSPTAPTYSILTSIPGSYSQMWTKALSARTVISRLQFTGCNNPNYSQMYALTVKAQGSGAQGAQGANGANGTNGSQGPQGFQGAFGGPQGFQGATGAQGATGSTGSTGAQGTQGFQGATGSTGAQGTQGFQGTTGSTGAQGTQGFQGTTGAQGAQGNQGSQGNQGVGIARNYIINGAMDIWQRATATTNLSGVATGYITADRWTMYDTANVGAQSGRLALPTNTGINASYANRFTATGNGAAPQMAQAIEALIAQGLQGQQVTFSCWARCSTTGKSFVITQNYNTSTDVATYTTATGTSNSGNLSLTTSWQQFSFTFTVNSAAVGLAILLKVNSINNTQTVDFTGCQLEIGAAATTFNRANPTIAGELASCQRFYYSIGPANSQVIGGGGAHSITAGTIACNFPVTMRAQPALVVSNAANYFYATNGAGLSSTNFSTLTSSLLSPSGAMLVTSAFAGVQTINIPIIAYTANAAAFVAFNSEL